MTKGIKEKDIRDFEKYAEKLDEIICRIRKYNKEANLYLACDVLNLMSGEAHSNYGAPQQENVVTSVILTATDGGDW